MNYVLTQHDHDLLQALLRKERGRKAGNGDGRPNGPHDGEPTLTFDTTVTIPSYGCFVETSLTITDHTEVITAAKPSTSNMFVGKPIFVNGVDEVVHDKHGSCQRLRNGTLRIAYDSSATPTMGETWGAKYGQFTLSQWWPGYRFCGLWDSDNRIGIWEPVPILTLHGKADAAIAKGATTGTVSVWVGATGSEVDSTVNITNCHARGAAITSGKIVTVTFINGVPYVGAWEC